MGLSSSSPVAGMLSEVHGSVRSALHAPQPPEAPRQARGGFCLFNPAAHKLIAVAASTASMPFSSSALWFLLTCYQS